VGREKEKREKNMPICEYGGYSYPKKAQQEKK
jgi:hypothetical protein